MILDYPASLTCQLCGLEMFVDQWPDHRDRHILEIKRDPQAARFCQRSYSRESGAIVCRKRYLHPGQHSGPLGALKW